MVEQSIAFIIYAMAYVLPVVRADIAAGRAHVGRWVPVGCHRELVLSDWFLEVAGTSKYQ